MAGRMCTLPLPGVFLLGPQGSAGAAGGRRDGCHGCCRCLGRSHWWREGRRGFGSHRAGTGELDDQRGERGWFAPSSARCSWRCHSAACGRPPLGHRAVARLGVWLLQAARCPWKSLACSCATGMEEKRRGAGGALRAVCATPCVTGWLCSGTVPAGQLDPKPVPAAGASSAGSSRLSAGGERQRWSRRRGAGLAGAGTPGQVAVIAGQRCCLSYFRTSHQTPGAAFTRGSAARELRCSRRDGSLGTASAWCWGGMAGTWGSRFASCVVLGATVPLPCLAKDSQSGC